MGTVGPMSGRSCLVAHRRRKTFRTIVPTIDTSSMSPIGTNTVTFSDFHRERPGDAINAELGEAERTQPDDARTTALTSRTLPAVSMRRGYPVAPASPTVTLDPRPLPRREALGRSGIVAGGLRP